MSNFDFAGMIDRYVYDVTRRLPKAQREDIDKELRGLIEDMLEERTPEATKQDLEAVLTELGRPSKLAAKYRGSKRFLIGPELFDMYFLVLKIVLAATAFGLTLALVIGLVASPPQNVWLAIGEFFASILSGVVQSFAYVTLVFAIIERFAKGKDKWKDEWKPIDLPEIPKSNTRISYGDPIAGIVFIVIVLMIINLTPESIGIYTFSEPITVTPIFNLDVFRSMIILIDIILCLGIVKEAFKLISGKYTLQLAVATTVINVACIILSISVFLPPAIWNQELVGTLRNVADMTWAEGWNLEYWWSIVPKIIVGLSVFGYVVEIITNFVRGAVNAVRN